MRYEPMNRQITARKIKQLRELRDYTQQHMADRLGVKQNTYSVIESGGIELTMERLEIIATTLEVPLEELVSSDPITLHMHDNSGPSGFHAVQHNTIPLDVFQKITDKQNELMERIVDLLSRLSAK